MTQNAQSLTLVAGDNAFTVHPSVFDNLGGSFSFGPLTVTYNINTNPIDISGSLSLFGISMGSFNLNAQNPTIGIDISAMGVGVTGSLSLDIPNSNFNGSFTIKYFVGEKTWSGTIYHW